MNQFNLFIELTRLKKPIGYMLLFWPCAWGLTIAYDFSNQKITFFLYLFLSAWFCIKFTEYFIFYDIKEVNK